MLALVLLLSAEQRTFGAGAYVVASALTLSFTVTNWMVGLLVSLARWPWKQAVQLSVNALCLVVLLWGVQKFIFPSSEFSSATARRPRLSITRSPGDLQYCLLLRISQPRRADGPFCER